MNNIENWNRKKEAITLFDLSDYEQGWFRTSIAVNRIHAKLMNNILNAGFFHSRSELIRYCLNRYAGEILEIKKGITEIKPEILKVLL